jgi:hypothetical protein
MPIEPVAGTEQALKRSRHAVKSCFSSSDTFPAVRLMAHEVGRAHQDGGVQVKFDDHPFFFKQFKRVFS